MSGTGLHDARGSRARRVDRTQRWVAAGLTALLHLLLVLVLLIAEPVTVTTPQGSAAGSRQHVTQVDFIGGPESSVDPVPSPAPAAETPPQTPATRARPAPGSRVRTTRVPDEEATSAAETAAPPSTPPDRPAPASQADSAATRSRAQAASGRPPPSPRRAPTWGQPPGMLPEDHAAENAGPAPSAAIERGRGRVANDAGPSLVLGGYQVYYDLRSEQRLREWSAQGMTELYLPLPGIREVMVCPLEIALRRDSGACRLLEPGAPELAAIGDAREVITVMRVYRRGDLVFRGPRPYR